LEKQIFWKPVGIRKLIYRCLTLNNKFK
jgi:hypothetical protein